MSCYFNIKLSQFNPEGKFEFPGKKSEPIREKDYREIYLIKVFTFKYILKLNAAFSAE